MEFKSKWRRAIKADATSAPVLRSRGIQSALCCLLMVTQTVYTIKGLPSHGCWDRHQQPCLEMGRHGSSFQVKGRSLFLWCNLVVYFNSTNFSKKLQNTRMERTQDSQFFLLFLLFVYIVSSHGDYSYIQ